jgi:flavin-dependent dehydrogenase
VTSNEEAASGRSRPNDVEVAIVGGGPAGLSTALFLAAARPELAARIVVLEKKAYPREKYCAGAIGARGDELLRSIGVTVGVPSVPIDGLSVRTEVGSACERLPGIGRVVRRIEFDHALANAARDRGIRVEEGTRVTGLSADERGVTLETPAGSVRARVVVGADGVGSFVRRAIAPNGEGSGAPDHAVGRELESGELLAQVVELDTEPVPGDLPRDLLHFDVEDRSFPGYAWDFPTIVHGEPMMCRGVYHLRLDDRPVDIVATLEQRLARQGLDIGRYKLKRYAERGFRPAAPNAIPRVLLVGEAAGIDALSGEGIAQSIEYAALAGPYLAEKLDANDLSFHDWPARIKASKLGVDLRLRHRLLVYYGASYRSWFERHVLLTPQFITCSMERFSGRRVNMRRLVRPVLSAAWAFAASAGR